jgi:MFS family permease
MLVCCVFAGLGAGFIQPGMQGQMADILDGREGGRVIAAFQMAGDVGQIAGPVVAGWLVDISGYGLAFAFAGSLLLLASGPWLRMNFSSRGA